MKRSESDLIPAETLTRREARPNPARKDEALLDDSRHSSTAERVGPLPYEPPRIIKSVVLSPNRRQFVTSLVAGASAACSEIDIVTEGGVCTCHAVCTCDTVGSSENTSERESEYTGTVCSCNTVCTCNTVCSCESVGGSSGGGGSTYFY